MICTAFMQEVWIFMRQKGVMGGAGILKELLRARDKTQDSGILKVAMPV